MTVLTDAAAARAWLATLPGVSRETLDRLDAYVLLLRAANHEQNLIAASTAGESLWLRHIADSAQLIPLAAGHRGAWVDLGSGPGLPGLVVAILDSGRMVTLVESRRRRCDFLAHVIDELGLGGRVTVVDQRVEQLPPHAYAVISARAFAPLPRLLTKAQHLAGKNTLWLLPKGQNAVNELCTIPLAWQRLFHVEPSLTDVDARILVGEGLPS